MKTIYLAKASYIENSNKLEYHFTESKEKYINYLERLFDVCKIENAVIQMGKNFDFYQKKVAYNANCENEYEEYTFYYNLEKTKLICHKSLFDHHLMLQPQQYLSYNRSYLMLYNYGVSFETLHNHYGYHYGDIDNFPEFITMERYVLHDKKSFFKLDFKSYFLEDQEDENEDEYFNEIKERNIKIWLHLFGLTDQFNQNLSPIQIKNRRNKLIYSLINNKFELSVLLFDSKMKNKSNKKYLSTYM
jgi:hypothetical protein